jgi:lambda family phage portal protein
MAKPRIRIGTDGSLRGAVVDGEVMRPRSSYMRGNQSPFFFNWNPALREIRDDVRVGYIEAAARTIDAMQNSGWLAGAVDQSIASTIGTGLRLAARPDRMSLGWDSKKADDWSETVERRWTIYSESALECDIAGKMTVAQMTDAVLRSSYGYGEALALLPFLKRPFNMNGTKVQLLPPTRLVQDSSPFRNKYQGVTTDRHGLPLSYAIKMRAEDATTIDIRARDGLARPQVAHIFEGQIGQMRGITPLAPVLRTVKQYDQLSDATLQAALIQALFAATVEGTAPTEEILRSLQSEDEQSETQGVGSPGYEPLMSAQAAWYSNAKIDLSGLSRVVHMFPGEKLTFNRSEHPNSTYESFAKFLLREVARCLGMTFETLTGDYAGATYSSVRMATSEIWPIILRRRNNICGRFLQVVYEAWLEEEIEQGHIPFDNGIFGYIANRPAAVMANWRGPAKPQADDLKTAKAHQVYKQMGIMSDERIADDLGFDIGDEYERRSREKKLRASLDLPEGDTMAPDPEVDALLAEERKAEDA